MTGTRYFSTEALDIDDGTLVTEDLVVAFGDVSIAAEPGRVGGFGTCTVELSDNDLALRDVFDTQPGVQNRPAYLHLFFITDEDDALDTDWPDDRVTLFGGTIAAPADWSEATGVWRLTIQGLEEYEDKKIGREFNRVNFPEANCEDATDEAIIPIAYGSPVYRVPAVVIDRPGAGYLGTTLLQHDLSAEIHLDASKLNFTIGSEISLVVGYPGNFEVIVGTFLADGTTFTLSSPKHYARGSIEVSGTTDGTYAVGGVHYIKIPKSDFNNLAIPGVDDEDKWKRSRGGYIFHLFHNGGWTAYPILLWRGVGDDVAVLQWPKDEPLPSSSSPYAISTLPGLIAVWPPGTPVYEIGTWTYAINHMPIVVVFGEPEQHGVERQHGPRAVRRRHRYDHAERFAGQLWFFGREGLRHHEGDDSAGRRDSDYKSCGDY